MAILRLDFLTTYFSDQASTIMQMRLSLSWRMQSLGRVRKSSDNEIVVSGDSQIYITCLDNVIIMKTIMSNYR